MLEIRYPEDPSGSKQTADAVEFQCVAILHAVQPDQVHLIKCQLHLVRPVIDAQINPVSKTGKNIRMFRINQYHNPVFLCDLFTLQTAEYNIFQIVQTTNPSAITKSVK